MLKYEYDWEEYEKLKPLVRVSYDKYWSLRGEYGLERIRRKNLRKQKRWEKVGKCKCGMNYRSSSLRPCPYDVEMSWGPPSLCRCCDSCRHDCAMSV